MYTNNIYCTTVPIKNSLFLLDLFYREIRTPRCLDAPSPAARINRPLLGKDTVHVRDFHGVSTMVFVDKLGMLSWCFPL